MIKLHPITAKSPQFILTWVKYKKKHPLIKIASTWIQKEASFDQNLKLRAKLNTKHYVSVCKTLTPIHTPTSSHNTICSRSIKLIKKPSYAAIANQINIEPQKSVAYQQANPSAQKPWYRLNRTRNRVVMIINRGSKPNQNVSQRLEQRVRIET